MPTINHRTQGFTLIELLIVISVISLLSTIVLYRTSEAKYKAEDAKMRVEVREVEKAIVMYKDDNNGQVPVGSDYTNDKLGEMVQEDSDAFKDSMQILVDKGYLSQIPQSSSGESYVYLATSDKRNAVFAANLNNNYSNNTSNSCSFVGGGDDVEWGGCRTFMWQQIFPTTCSDIDYDVLTEKCFENVHNYCRAEADEEIKICNGYSINTSIVPDQACYFYDYDEDYSEKCRGSEDYGITAVCYFTETTTSVCSGSDTSDFCACI